MNDELDLSALPSRPNPYAERLKKSVTIRLGEDVIDYFKALAAKTAVPYQTLINLYLRDCMISRRRPDLAWRGDEDA